MSLQLWKTQPSSAPHEEIPRFFVIDFVRRRKKRCYGGIRLATVVGQRGTTMNWKIRLYDSGAEFDTEEADYHIRLKGEISDTTETVPHPDSAPSCSEKRGPFGLSAPRRKRRALKARAGE